jgi:transposase-like protein
MGKSHRLAPDVKEQILRRLKEEGIPASQLAEEHGISVYTIYGWLSRGIAGHPTLKEFTKLKKDNAMLLALVGELTVKLSAAQKKS